MGKKHKRSKAHSRFLLQVRLFCQKTCKTYDFVLLFQFENAKTEISITHHLRRISSASGNSPMRASDPTNHLQCLPQSIKVPPRRDEGIPPYRLFALPAAYYKKLCRERLIPVQEPNQRSGWPLKFDCGRSDLPYIFRITLPAKNLSPFYPIRPEKNVDKPRFIWYIIQAIFCGHGPLVKRLRQRPLTPLTSVRFRYGSPFYSSKTAVRRFI